jgi:hypothetical protein
MPHYALRNPRLHRIWHVAPLHWYDLPASYLSLDGLGCCLYPGMDLAGAKAAVTEGVIDACLVQDGSPAQSKVASSTQR